MRGYLRVSLFTYFQKSDILYLLVTIQNPICKIAASQLSFCSCGYYAI